MRFKKLCIAVSVVMQTYSWHSYCVQATVSVAVTEVVAYPCDGSLLEVEAFYATLPMSVTHMQDNWPRLHQILFNQSVQIIKEYNNQSYIEISDCWLVDITSKTTVLRGWVLSKDLYKHNSKHYNGLAYAIPNQACTTNQTTLILAEPWCDQVTRQCYSAGTRFVCNAQSNIAEFCGIYLVDPITHTVRHALVHQKGVVVESSRTKQQKKDIFIAVLKQWCSYEKPIAYVLGGLSVSTLRVQDVALKELQYQSKPIMCWQQKHLQDTYRSGFDCSGMILSAARIAGMPYNFKNTASIRNALKPLGMHDTLCVGDLLYTKGHIMVVASLHPACMIEAAGYDKGYGAVHMVKLQERYKDVKTWDELLDYYYTAKVPIALNKDGSYCDNPEPIVFLSLESLYKDPQVCI